MVTGGEPKPADFLYYGIRDGNVLFVARISLALSNNANISLLDVLLLFCLVWALCLRDGVWEMLQARFELPLTTQASQCNAQYIDPFTHNFLKIIYSRSCQDTLTFICRCAFTII